jgi:hypothetical protein
MNDLRGGCGRRFRLSHLRRFYKTDTTRSFLSTRTTTTTFTYRNFRVSAVRMTSKQEKWTAPLVRKTFLEFFEGKGHTVGRWRGTFFFAGAKYLRLGFQLLEGAHCEL